MIYLDNAATSQKKPQAVYDAVLYAMGNMGNAGRSSYGASHSSSKTVFETRTLLAAFFHGNKASNCIFTKNSTESLNIAIQGSLAEGDHVITTVMEHNSVLRPLYAMEKRGVELSYLSYSEERGLHYEELETLLQKNTKALICTHASNLTGDMVDLERMGAFAKKHGLLFIVDASQTAGVYEIDCEKWGISVLCFTGHKSLYGPGGTGGMIVKTDVDVKPLITGGDGIHTFDKEFPHTVPGVFEAGTENIAGIAGLEAGIQLLLERGEEDIARTQQELSDLFIKGLQEISNLTLYADLTRPRVNVFAINIGEAEAALVGEILWEEYAMATRAGFHCAPLIHKELHTDKRGIVRFSFSLFTTKQEVEAALAALRDIAKR